MKEELNHTTTALQHRFYYLLNQTLVPPCSNKMNCIVCDLSSYRLQGSSDYYYDDQLLNNSTTRPIQINPFVVTGSCAVIVTNLKTTKTLIYKSNSARYLVLQAFLLVVVIYWIQSVYVLFNLYLCAIYRQ